LDNFNKFGKCVGHLFDIAGNAITISIV